MCRTAELTVGSVELQHLQKRLQVAEVTTVVFDQVQGQQQGAMQASFHTKLAVCQHSTQVGDPKSYNMMVQDTHFIADMFGSLEIYSTNCCEQISR